MKNEAEYYELSEDYYLDYGITGNPSPKTDISFFTGKKIEKEVPLLTFEATFPSGHSPHHLLTGGTLLMSTKMVHCLEKAGVNNFQTFPVLLHNPETGESWNNYVAVNIIGIVAAADIKNSDTDTLMEGDSNFPDLLAFRSISLLRKKLNDLLIFRMAESANTIIIHRKLRELLKANRPEEGWGIMYEKVTVTE